MPLTSSLITPRSWIILSHKTLLAVAAKEHADDSLRGVVVGVRLEVIVFLL
jgi:hypothetical protein